MLLHLKQDKSFDLYKPYLHVTKIEYEDEYKIYCDGSHIELYNESFACIGGLIINRNNIIVAEFYGPIKTKNVLGINTNSKFEMNSINLAICLSQHLKIKKYTILNDSMSDVEKVKSLNNKINIQWIPRKENLADSVVTYAKQIWRKNNKENFLKFQNRETIFSKTKNHLIEIYQYNKNKNYYFMALDENNNIINYQHYYNSVHFGEIDLIIDLLNKKLIQDCCISIDKNLHKNLINYAYNKSQIKYLKIYENLFCIILDYPYRITLKAKENNSEKQKLEKDLYKIIKSKEKNDNENLNISL